MVQECLLEEAAQQKQILETLSVLDFEKVSKATCVEESKCLSSIHGLPVCVAGSDEDESPGGLLSLPNTQS